MSEFAKSFIAAPGQPFDLSSRPTRMDDLYADKKAARDAIKQDSKQIKNLAHKLYGEAERSLLIVLQGMDTSGKDSTTSAIFARTPPLNAYVHSFKSPSKDELSHDYLWRVHKACPGKGQICVFNRSQYEDVLVVKVRSFVPASQVEQRYGQINDFERMLSENGTRVLKFMLNISYETQGERLSERLEIADKRWKFNPGDLEDRKLWPDFMNAYETMVERTSTSHAPWHVIPSDNRAVRSAIITQIVKETLQDMAPAYPDPGYRPDHFEIG